MLARLLRRYVRYAPPWCPTAAAADLLDRHLPDHPITTITRTRHGSRIPVTTSDIIQRYLYLFGVWEPHITGWLQSRLRPGDTFIDIGYYSLLAARCVGPTGHVGGNSATRRRRSRVLRVGNSPRPTVGVDTARDPRAAAAPLVTTSAV